MTAFSIGHSSTNETVTTPRVNVAVCGIFHYRSYIGDLARSGLLNHFYYSHRRETTPTSLRLGGSQGTNLFLKEYLTRLHLKLIRHRFGNLMFPRYQDLFDSGVVRNWSECNLLHVMQHGGGQRTIRHARQRGARVLGEPVNTHPVFMQNLMREEHDRLGLPDKSVRQLNVGQQRMLEEADACDHLLVASDLVKRSYVQHGTPPEKISIVPYGADLSKFCPGKRDDDGIFRVLIVGQISVRKGHIDLIEAWEKLNLPNAELVFVGTMTPEMEHVLKPKRHLFRYDGPMPHHALVKAYRNADVVVVPSIEDGFSYVPLEAMSCGVPVIVSRNAGAAEVIREGVTGFTVPVRSPDSLQQALLTLWKDPERRREMGRAAREVACQSFGWDLYAQSVAQLYWTVLNRPNPQTVEALQRA